MSLSSSALMGTYLLSIGCVTTKRLRGEKLPFARWSLGRSGLVINILALLYAVWSFFWSFWPTYYNITMENFNWASVLFVAVMMVSIAIYLVTVVILKRENAYRGPVVNVLLTT